MSSTNSVNAMGPLARLEEILRKLGREMPHSLRELLVDARSLSGKSSDAPDKDVRSFIYKSLYSFLVNENGVGEGCSLIYPPEIVTIIRELYPGDIKNYTPKSGKRRNFYEVELEEMVELYHEADLRKSIRKAFDSLPPLDVQDETHRDDEAGPSAPKKKK